MALHSLQHAADAELSQQDAGGVLRTTGLSHPLASVAPSVPSGGAAGLVSLIDPQLDSCCFGTSSGVEGGRLVDQRGGHGEYSLS